MKLIVLVPSADYTTYAGARIRYQRIAPRLAELGIDMALEDIKDFAPNASDADVVVISKCYDPRSLVAAAIMAGRGRLVGVDLFDDYFSQNGDSRMARFRLWLEQVLQSCAFVLTSTERMASIADSYRPGIAVHVMNDPAADFQLEQLPDILERKLAEARDGLRLTIGWFGVGDNPHFPVGLHDLAGFAGMLHRLRAGGWDVTLRILTNARALTAKGLSLIDAVPVRTELQEWSEDRERALLAAAFAAFVPVNTQPFSTAKSLNRAVTALTAGCQLLSAGYPLYRQLDELIYRDAGDLARDLERGSLRLSPRRMRLYREAMETFASAAGEASRLANFLAGLEPSKWSEGPIVLVHGHSTNGAAHKLVQAAGGLSVASPCCSVTMGFDVVFKATPGGLSMRVSEKARRRLAPELLDKLSPVADSSGGKFLELSDNHAPSGAAAVPMTCSKLPLTFQLASYSRWMDEIRTRVTAAFAPSRMVMAETSPLPFGAAV